MMRQLFWMCGVSLVCVMIAGQSTAQTTCPALVESAVATLAEACTDLAPGTVCYGSQAVEEAFTADAAPDADTTRTSLNALERITAFAADLDAGTWGTAALSLEDVSGGEVIALLTGEATLSRPAETEAVPGPFTELTLQTAPEAGPCTEAPSLLAVYTGEGTTASLQINSQSVRLTGLVTLQWQSPNSLSATVHSGELAIANGETVMAGSTANAVMDNNAVVQFWSASRTAFETELAVAAPVGRLLTALGYSVEVAPAPMTAQTANCGTFVTHTVASGENLFRISQRYGTTVDALVVANNIPDRSNIYTGQQLTVPCPNEVDTSTPPAPANTSPVEAKQAAAESPCDVVLPPPNLTGQLGLGAVPSGTIVVPEVVVPCSP
jgi:LysM repeat protein